MTSKHEPHAALISKLLLEGRTYTSIVKELAELGCATSRQALTDWLKKRAERARNRSYLADPAAYAQAQGVVGSPAGQETGQEEDGVDLAEAAAVAAAAAAPKGGLQKPKVDLSEYIQDEAAFERAQNPLRPKKT